MAASLPAISGCDRSRFLATIVFMTSLMAALLAVGRDKALYMGGNLREFPKGGLLVLLC
jgi:hypothetical protein